MILLIRDKMRRRVMTIANLNSIMILLIRSSNHSMPIYPNSFKFHYDSINSLIENIKNSQSFNLNSIMILLILIYPCVNVVLLGDEFKFHYDSINSQVQMLIIQPKIIDLNSIMILLIQLNQLLAISCFVYLNSIMILLIQSS